MAITKQDIPDYAPATIELPNGRIAEVRVEDDDTMPAPWDAHDGHGPVREVRSGESPKSAGERVLHRDGYDWTLYDFAEAVKIARKDGWDAANCCGNWIKYGWGAVEHGDDCARRTETKREQAVRAVESDFERLRAWCRDEWRWIGVVVELKDADGETVEQSSVWGIESDTDYWRDVAAELVNELASGRPNYAI